MPWMAEHDFDAGAVVPDVATYIAVIGRKVERATLVRHAGFSRTEFLEAVVKPPEWDLPRWPEGLNMATVDGLSSPAIDALILLKLRSLLDWRAESQEDNPNSIRNAVVRRYKGFEANEIRKFEVRAGVRVDGDPHWEYGDIDDGPLPAGVTEDTVFRGASGQPVEDIQFIVQSLARADIRDRLALVVHHLEEIG